MTKYEFIWNAPETLNADLTSFYALTLSILRFAIERYGGTVETDPATGAISIGIPDWSEDECCEELWKLLGPGKPLHGFMHLLCVESCAHP